MKQEVTEEQDDHSCLGSYELLLRKHQQGRERDRREERESETDRSRGTSTQRDGHVHETCTLTARFVQNERQGRTGEQTDRQDTVDTQTNERTVVRYDVLSRVRL